MVRKDVNNDAALGCVALLFVGLHSTNNAAPCIAQCTMSISCCSSSAGLADAERSPQAAHGLFSLGEVRALRLLSPICCLE